MENLAVSASTRPRGAAGVIGMLSFIRPQLEKPVFRSAALTGGEPKLFFEMQPHAVWIADMRKVIDTLSLDRQGFALLECRSRVRDFRDDGEIRNAYHAEVRQIVRGALGAQRVEIFDMTRRSDADAGAPNRHGVRHPATRVHVDYTQASGPRRLADVVGSQEAARLAAAHARVVQVNVWRPTRGPVERSPLAIADAASVRAADLIATDQIFPDRTGEIYHLRYNPDQRWYFAPRMTTAEALLIKGWDSLADGRARFTPHASFQLPDTPPAARPRESIEVRTFAIFE